MGRSAALRRIGMRARGIGLLLLLGAGCGVPQAVGRGVTKGAVEEALRSSNQDAVAALARRVAAEAIAGALERAAAEPERAEVQRVVHDAVDAVMSALDARLTNDVGPHLREQVRLAVKAALDEALGDGSRGRIEATVEALVQKTVATVRDSLSASLRGELADAAATALRDKLGPAIDELVARRVGPQLERLIVDRVGPGLGVVLDRDLGPRIAVLANAIGKSLVDGALSRFQPGGSGASTVTVVLIVAVSVLGLGLLLAGLQLYRTWHADDALQLVVAEIARRREQPEIRELAHSLRNAGSRAGGGKYLAKFVEEDEAGRNVFRDPPHPGPPPLTSLVE